MTDASNFIDIQVLHEGREVAAGRHKLPFTIGRGAKGQNSIVIGRDDLTISSTHARVERRDGRLQLSDTSRNGTYYNGRKLGRFETVDLADRDCFAIRGYVINVRAARLDPKILTVFEAEIFENNISKLRIDIGEMALLFIRTPDGLWFEPIPFKGADYDLIVGQHKLKGEYPFGVLVGSRRQGSLFLDFHATPPPVLLNLSPVTERESAVAPLDVIQIGTARIELHAPGNPSLKCPNARCELLNPYDHHDFCRFCGFSLVDAETSVSEK